MHTYSMYKLYFRNNKTSAITAYLQKVRTTRGPRKTHKVLATSN